MAIPRPVSAPIDRLIWLSATCPKITARIEPSQKIQTMPSTMDAIARPLVRVAVARVRGRREPAAGPPPWAAVAAAVRRPVGGGGEVVAAAVA